MTNSKDCVHYYICVYEKCGKCGQHLHDEGKVVA